MNLLEAAEVDFTAIKREVKKLELGDSSLMIVGLLKLIWVAVALKFDMVNQAEVVYWGLLESIIKENEKGCCDHLRHDVCKEIEVKCGNDKRV